MAQPQTSRIQNAEVRYQNRMAERGIAATVDQKIRALQTDQDAENDAEYDSISEDEAESLAYFENESLLSRTKNTKYKKGESELLDELKLLSQSDQRTVVLQKATMPTFPIFILIAALFKDILDIPTNLSLVAALLSSIFGFFLSMIIFFWIFGKMNGKWWKKRLIKWLWKRYVLAMIVEMLPGISLVPLATIFVLMAHYREKKIVILANKALEALRFGLQKGTY